MRLFSSATARSTRSVALLERLNRRGLSDKRSGRAWLDRLSGIKSASTRRPFRRIRRFRRNLRLRRRRRRQTLRRLRIPRRLPNLPLLRRRSLRRSS